jgi:hypothetical protein
MFDNLKSIVVIRDPRDQFISFCENLKEFAPTDVNSFCCLYEQNMRTIDVNNNSIVIRFEDFVMDFERESLKIRKFLGIKIEDHFVEVNLFNKEKSSSRIGKWRNYNDQESIKVIEKKLKNYCYNAK